MTDALQSENLEILALIPARGGSKGIPGKNLVPVAGAPLLAHSVAQALATPAVGRVVVSTDDEGIATAARRAGAEVVERPAELAGDEASSESALAHALGMLAEEGYRPDLVVFLQATSLLRRPDEIQRAIETLRAEEADSLFSAAPAHGFVWRRTGSELEALTYDPARRPRRQDIGEDLMENGSIYIFKPWVLEQQGNRLGGKITVHPMHPLDSFQIDEPHDLPLFEELARLRPGSVGAPATTEQDLRSVRLLALDFDGVLTDDRVLVNQEGTEAVFCHRGDGLGLEMVRRAGVQVAVISKERNPVVAARCEKLQVRCLQGIDDKLPQLQALAAELEVEQQEILFMGNDVNDLDCLRWAGTSAAPADARPQVRAEVDIVTQRAGGRGAVREICDQLFAARRAPGAAATQGAAP